MLLLWEWQFSESLLALQAECLFLALVPCPFQRSLVLWGSLLAEPSASLQALTQDYRTGTTAWKSVVVTAEAVGKPDHNSQQ
jgi:hypothetical protein